MTARPDTASKPNERETLGTPPERLCAVRREHLPQDQLLRFVLAPDGGIVPDIESRLPGRGVWLTCSRKVVEKAVETKVFSKSLKLNAQVSPTLPQNVEDLLLRRLNNYLSLANKAGRAVAGFQQVETAVEKAQLAALLHGAEAAEDGCLKLNRKFKAIQRERGFAAPIINSLSIAQMSLAMGRPSVVHAGLIPGGLTERFLREAERLERYRSGQGLSDQPNFDDE